MQRRRLQPFVPSRLAVVMRMYVDEAWSDHRPVSIDGVPGHPFESTYFDDHSVRNGDVCCSCRRPVPSIAVFPPL